MSPIQTMSFTSNSLSRSRVASNWKLLSTVDGSNNNSVENTRSSSRRRVYETWKKNENNETTKRHKNNNEYNDNNTSECDWALGLELRIGDWVSKWRERVRGIRKGRKGGKWFLFVANGIFLLSLARRIVFSVPFFKLGYLGQRKTKPGEE